MHFFTTVAILFAAALAPSAAQLDSIRGATAARQLAGAVLTEGESFLVQYTATNAYLKLDETGALAVSATLDTGDQSFHWTLVAARNNNANHYSLQNVADSSKLLQDKCRVNAFTSGHGRGVSWSVVEESGNQYLKPASLIYDNCCLVKSDLAFDPSPCTAASSSPWKFIELVPIPSSTPSAMPSLQPSATPTTSVIQADENGCYTGTAEEVSAACAHNGDHCCSVQSGTGASCRHWVGEATVCPNSCQGTNACYGLAEGVAIGAGSCQGTLACSHAEARPTSTSGYSIEEGSCIDHSACRNLRMAVREEACIGSRSCYSSWQAPDEYLEDYIGYQSCVGAYSCYMVSDSIAQLSCQGDYACSKASGIGMLSCKSNGACFKAQTVSSQSCKEAYSCFGASAGIGHLQCTTSIGE